MTAARVALLGVALLFLYGIVAFARSKPVCEVVLPRLADRPAGRHDLVDYRYGPTVRASSSALAYQHHPAFLVDGVEKPSGTEKWVSADKDVRPWLELTWDRPRTVDEIAFTFAGAFEGAALNETAYTVRCLGTSGSVEITNNTESRPRHPLACTGATGVRIEFPHARPAPHDIVRVYEVEVLGQ